MPSTYIQKLFIILIFAIFTPITIFASAFSLLSLNQTKKVLLSAEAKLPANSTRILSSSDSNSFPSISSNIVHGDGRSYILDNYLQKVGSELQPYSELLVTTADKYSLDYRLLTAIAVKESGACRVIPPGSHNCWGWGIHSAGTLMFDSYEEAIETVSKGLKEKYIDLGYVTPDQIMKKYAHKDSTTWGPDVSAYMDALE